jgi:hypothetical protein
MKLFEWESMAVLEMILRDVCQKALAFAVVHK